MAGLAGHVAMDRCVFREGVVFNRLNGLGRIGDRRSGSDQQPTRHGEEKR